jgi:LysM repeat protein
LRTSHQLRDQLGTGRALLRRVISPGLWRRCAGMLPTSTGRSTAMTLHDKYNDVLGLAQQLNVKNGNVKEEGGKLKLSGTTEYQLDANQLWDKIKEHSGWENEIQADIRAEKTDIFGYHTVKSGDTLSKIAKNFLGDSNRYTDIFNLNRDQLKDPDKIQAGQRIKIPNR